MTQTREENFQIVYDINYQIDRCQHFTRTPKTLDGIPIAGVYTTGSKPLYRTGSLGGWQELTNCVCPTFYYGIYRLMETRDGRTDYWIQDDAGGEQHLTHWPTENDIRQYRNLALGILN